jgi:precorrin isomerase
MAEVGAVFGSELPVNGARLASLCAMSELTGAPVGDAMKAAAERSERSAASRRKRRSALAQVRFSAWVVGVAPLVLTLLVVLTRGIPQPRGAIIVIPMVVGFVLQVTGTATVFVLSGRAA